MRYQQAFPKINPGPCIFCLSDDVEMLEAIQNKDFCKIKCNTCQLETPITSKKEAIARWNRINLNTESIPASKALNIIEGWVDGQEDNESVWPYGVKAHRLKDLIDKIRNAL